MVEQGEPRRNVQRRILLYYEKDDWKELAALIEAACTYKSVKKRRRKVLCDVQKILKAGKLDDFNAANFVLPRLFIEAEDLARLR